MFVRTHILYYAQVQFSVEKIQKTNVALPRAII